MDASGAVSRVSRVTCCDELRDMFVMLQLTWKTFDP